MSSSAATAARAAIATTHPVDQISLGKIVQIREQLLQAQAVGRKVFRFE